MRRSPVECRRPCRLEKKGSKRVLATPTVTRLQCVLTLRCAWAPADFYVEPGADMTGSTLSEEKMDTRRCKGDCKNGSAVTDSYRKTRVASVDAADFLAAIARASDFVAIKLDIEGFEYRLLPHLLDSGSAAACSLSVAAIEWHGRMMPGQANTGHLKWRLAHQCNTTLLNWA